MKRRKKKEERDEDLWMSFLQGIKEEMEETNAIITKKAQGRAGLRTKS